MAAIASTAVRKLHEMFTGATGMPYTVAAIAEREQVSLPPIEAGQIATHSVAADLAERTAGVAYPAVYVFCEALHNVLKEKFRTFSGKAAMVAEVRSTHDRLDRVSRELELYTAAVTEILDAHRGDWGGGMFYAGGYKIEYGTVKRGGRNFAQSARITFELDVSL